MGFMQLPDQNEDCSCFCFCKQKLSKRRKLFCVVLCSIFSAQNIAFHLPSNYTFLLNK